MSDSTLDLMKDRRTCLVPTLALRHPMLATPAMQKAAPAFRKRLIYLFAAAHQTALQVWQKGVTLATGTDTKQSAAAFIHRCGRSCRIREDRYSALCSRLERQRPTRHAASASLLGRVD
jgi:hypothetical protein